jgi:glycosyltransferase involved in cell wall biosynthesis
MKKKKRAILFMTSISGFGGAERLMFEHYRSLEALGYDVRIICFHKYDDALIEGYNDFYVKDLLPKEKYRNNINIRRVLNHSIYLRLWYTVFSYKPQLIMAQNDKDCIHLYRALKKTRYQYSTFIHGTMMFFQEESCFKYSRFFEGRVNKIKKHLVGHTEFWDSEVKEKKSISDDNKWEKEASFDFLGVQRAKYIFCLTETMTYEVNILYDKIAIAHKGAYHETIFDHHQKYSLKNDFNLQGKKVILNLNRLDPRKRIDLVIRSFNNIVRKDNDVFLVIAGKGPDEQKLKDITKKENIPNVLFIGFVDEAKIYDYYKTCDLFVHPNWCDYVITVYEALAMNQKVLVTTEMNFDRELLDHSQIYMSEPNIGDFSTEMETALNSINDDPIPQELLRRYTWQNYFNQINSIILAR